MFLSFFSTTDYTTGIDYKDHPDCIHQEDLDFDPNIQTATLQGNKKEGYSIEITEKKRTIQEQIQSINDEFDQTIESFLSKYPKTEIEAFAKKEKEAEKVIAGEESTYISAKAEALGITALEFAKIILQKSDEYTALYIQLENEKDAKIAKIKANNS